MLALILALQAAPAPPPADVVVTGERLQKLHDQCRTGRCTPLRDAQASIAWAEALFREGRYRDAKAVLRDAVGRNRRFEGSDPKPVATLHEAYATVAWQEGDQDIHRDAVFDRVRILRANLSAADPAVRAAALAVGEMWQRLENPQEAEREFERVEQQALTAGDNGLALRARLLRARSQFIQGQRADAQALLASASTMPGAGEPTARAAIKAMRVRLAVEAGDRGEIDAAVRELSGATGVAGRPALVWAPPYPLTAEQLGAQGRGTVPEDLARAALTSPKPYEVGAVRWADVGFWIRPDGRTADVEVLRGSRGTGWVQPYLGQVAGRRYAASGAADGDPGVYRVERFTLRPGYVTPTGSLARRRGGVARLEVLDLTDPNARVTAAK